MDIQQYQKDRATELKAFKKEYNDLKVQYTALLTQAIYEKDPDAQNELVKQVLDINTQLASHVRDFVGQANGKFDPKTISDLTKEIIAYQKEYAEIKSATNRTEVLQRVLNRETETLNTIMGEFNIFFYMLLGMILIIVMLIFMTPGPPAQPLIPQLSSTSMFDSDSMLGGMRKVFRGYF
jgi:hypothetical protein